MSENKPFELIIETGDKPKYNKTRECKRRMRQIAALIDKRARARMKQRWEKENP